MIAANHFPVSEDGQRFCQFFDHRYNFILATEENGNRPAWKTISAYPIEHRNLWNRLKDNETLIGLSFGSATRYAVLDIDSGSPYHPANNEQAFKDLLGAFEDIGFNEAIVMQSSWSLGVHVYLVAPKKLPTFKLAKTLKLTAMRSGFSVKDGVLEIFPNVKSYNKHKPTSYRAHRLPLQEGSYLLDSDFTPYSNSIKTFLERADGAAAAQDIELIEHAIVLCDRIKTFRAMKGDNNKAAAFARDLKEQLDEGWTDFGQTNDILRVIGTYGRVFEGLGGESLWRYIASTAQSLPGYREFCRHWQHIERRAKEWARCIEKFYYPYGSETVRVGSFSDMVRQGIVENTVNKQRQNEAVERIVKAVAHLKQSLLELPKKVGEMKAALLRATSDLFRVRPSDKTLNRYRELWHPAFIGEKEGYLPSEAHPEESETKTTTGEELFSTSCHTPKEQPQKEVGNNVPSNSIPEVNSEKLATPPPYMKVKSWASDCTVFLYEGGTVASRVEIEGEKNLIFQSIQQNQLVIITDQIHSSFLLHPNREENVQVYVKPCEGKHNWLTGIPVLVKNLRIPP